MQRGYPLLFAVLLALGNAVAAPVSLYAQAPQHAVGRTGAIDESVLVVLKGNKPALASPANDRGDRSRPADGADVARCATRSSRRGCLEGLHRQPARQTSANFHVWLSPEQFAARFGVPKADTEQLKDWMKFHGFRVARIARGELSIEFSGTAGQVKEAFHTAIHAYAVDGATHYANASDPQIPAALASTVAGIATLHNFRKPSGSRVLGTAARAPTLLCGSRTLPTPALLVQCTIWHPAISRKFTPLRLFMRAGSMERARTLRSLDGLISFSPMCKFSGSRSACRSTSRRSSSTAPILPI